MPHGWHTIQSRKRIQICGTSSDEPVQSSTVIKVHNDQVQHKLRHITLENWLPVSRLSMRELILENPLENILQFPVDRILLQRIRSATYRWRRSKQLVVIVLHSKAHECSKHGQKTCEACTHCFENSWLLTKGCKAKLVLAIAKFSSW